MRAAVTTAAHAVVMRSVPEPEATDGQVLLRPLTVGICGSDLHLYEGDAAALSGSELGLPRIQGHEIGAEVVIDPSGGLEAGERVAVWPLLSCGRCRLCREGTGNACPALRVIGVHLDGGFAERLVVPADHVVPVGDVDAVTAAFVEPLSVGVHAVARSAVRPGDEVVVFGGGAVGQGICLALADAGIAPLLVDPSPARASAGEVWGARPTTDAGPEAVRARVAEATDGSGVDVSFDATGVPAVFDTALDVTRSGGTVVAVGMSSAAGPVHTGALAAKELSVLGSSCCTRAEFAAAADLARRWTSAIGALPVRHHPFAATASALEDAGGGEGVVKVFVDLTS